MEYLISQKLDVNAESIDGWTPVHMLAEKMEAPCMEVLLKAGGDVNRKDGEGRTPLHWASANRLPSLLPRR